MRIASKIILLIILKSAVLLEAREFAKKILQKNRRIDKTDYRFKE